MSKHPLGPWTETQSDSWQVLGRIYETYPSYDLSTILSNSIDLVPFIGSRSVNRTGVNNGSKLYIYPSPASLLKSETRVEEMYRCSGERFVGFDFFGRRRYAKFTGYGGGVSAASVPFSYAVMEANALESARNMAYNKLRNRINNSIAEGGIFTGEIKDTFRTLKHGASLIERSTTDASAMCRKIVKDVTKRRFTATAKDLADLILEFDFGVKPLINDVKKGIEAYYRNGEVKPIRRKVHGSFAIDYQSGYHTDNFHQPLPQYYILNLDVSKHQKLFIKMGCTVDLSADPGGLDDTLLQWGVSPIQLASVTYELFPYSWLLDHYTNMNDFIDWFSLRRGVAHLGWKVEIIKTLQTERLTPSTFSDCIVQSAKSGKVNRYHVTFTRVPFEVDSYLPQLVMKTPQIAQVVDEIALATSRISGLSSSLDKALGSKLSIRQRGTLTHLINERIIR